MIGLTPARSVGRRWMLLPFAVEGVLLQHAIQGSCPPVGLFRRFGVRTQREIDEERYALKALRGDFKPLEGGGSIPAGDLFEAVSRLG